MMTDIFGDLLHKDDHLTDGQMVCRAIVIFLLAIALVRLAGRRSFGLRTPFDTVISLLLGATLSRSIVGASSFTGTLGACLVLVILHRLLAYVCMHNVTIRRWVSGRDKILYENGQHNRSNMEKMLVSDQDLQEAARLMANEGSLTNIKTIWIERNGQISVVKKKQRKKMKLHAMKYE